MSTSSSAAPGGRRFVALLAFGYLALAVGVLTAWSDPATAYELSIYAATPLAFWVGAFLAVGVAVVVAHAAPAGRTTERLALALGPLAIVAVVALPVLRGYHFFGAGDPLSYLGWARLIDRGQLRPTELLYPGLQTTALLLSEVTGLPLRRTLLLVPPAFALAFVGAVALVVRAIAGGGRARVAGVFAPLLLLPINNVHTYVVPYPTTAAIFLAPLVLYALVRYVDDDGALLRVGDRRLGTPFGATLALAGVGVVLYHPQVGSTLVAILVTVLALQLFARRTDRRVGETPLARHHSIAVPAAVVAAFFLAWTPRFDRATGTFAATVTGLLGGEAPGDEIATRGSSLVELGGGVLELFLKLFGVSTLLAVVAGLVVLATVTRPPTDEGGADHPERWAALAYLTAALVPVLGLFGLFFLASVTFQPFRYLGFAMVFVTILAAVAYAVGLPGRSAADRSWFRTALRRTFPSSLRGPLAAVVLVGLLAPQLSMLFMSPHIYQPSNQVTETEMEGYATAFEHRDPDVWFAGPRGGPRRFVDAHYGTSGTETTPTGAVFEGKEEGIPFAVWGHNLTTFYDRCRYVALSDADYAREVRLYDGFRYGADGFRQFDVDPRIHRVQSNGDFRLYVIEPAGSTCTR